MSLITSIAFETSEDLPCFWWKPNDQKLLTLLVNSPVWVKHQQHSKLFCSEIEMLTGLEPVLITVISKGIIINPEKMSGRKTVFQTTLLRKAPDCSFADSIDDCPSNCFGNGDCLAGTCHCFLGFKGPDCGRGESHLQS